MSAPLAVITGASGGIGAALATRLVADGWRLHLVDVDAERLEVVRQSLVGAVSSAVSALETPAACAAALPSGGEGIDALVHLAGIFVKHPLGPESRAVYDDTLQHNATNAFDLAGAVVPRLRDGGAVVFASSLGFNRGAVDHPAYAMAKGAVVGLVRALSRQVGSRGIRVNGVAPGIIETRMTDELIEMRGREAILQTIPLGRLGQADDVAGVIAFLLSDDAAYITGQVINVDGGITNG
ncbi:MAG: SDR family oxidoreductase [Pseudomonadota bacterium]